VIASRARTGSSRRSRSCGPIAAGTGTSKRGRSIAATIASATASGVSVREPRAAVIPEPRSVATRFGMTTVSSTAGAAQLLADRLGQAEHGELRAAVDRLAGDADHRRGRAEVHDLPAPAGDHPRERELHPGDDAVDVDVDLTAGELVALVEERADGHDPRVVDEHVDRAERALRLGEERRERRAVGDVEREADRAIAVPGRPGDREGGVEVPERDLRAPGQEQAGRGQADAPPGPGDGDDTTVVRHVGDPTHACAG
jgi:hypothetical protein